MEEINTGATWPEDWPTSRRILQDLGCLGGYLYHHRGGRSGKDHVVTRLARHGGHMTQRELQTSFDIRSGSMSDVLAKVEAAGYITRSRSKADRRQMDIQLTEAGRKKAAQIDEGRRHFESEAFSCLSQDEAEQLLSLLDRVRDHWMPGGERGERCQHA